MEPKYLRTIRSFVKREGRLTPGQQKALDELWPKFGVEYTDQAIDLEKLFARSAPVVMEIGFGNGASLFQMAQANPDRNYLGIEVHRPGIGHLLQLIDEAGLENIRISNHDAVDVIRDQIAEQSITRFQLFFPDPWHKKKHHKRRIVQDDFVTMLAHKLKKDGMFHLATDWEDYAEHMLAVLNRNKNFCNMSPDNTYVPKPEQRPTTKFEKRGHRLGHGVWDLLFKKI
ncbi:MAG: tRNA (guanosine(46)-N7)-methyltransferase TrmB [Gammaproteobacteria bacterium]|nr:tRNA (guanosine(46)-N7)-methyltransferase TrmB [Gammaproteobacteria bacterium]